MSGKEAATIKELVEILSRFTPEQLDLFRLAAQQLIEQMPVRDDPRKF